MVLDSASVALGVAILSLAFNIGIYAATIKSLKEDILVLTQETAKFREMSTVTAVMNNRIATMENRFDSADIRLNNTSQRVHDLTKEIFHAQLRWAGEGKDD